MMAVPYQPCRYMKCILLVALAWQIIVNAPCIQAKAVGDLEQNDPPEDGAGVDFSNVAPVSEQKLPTLSEHEKLLLHALFGGIGPVILPSNSDGDINTDNDSHDPILQRLKRSRRENKLPPIPEQIHISYGDDPTKMVIMWSTPSPGSSQVVYGLAPNNFSSQSFGSFEVFVYDEFEDDKFEGVPYMHRVKLEGLIPGATYSYKVQTGASVSDPYKFTTMQDGTDWTPTLLVYGDMGRIGGAPSLRLLNRAAKEGTAHAILHVGDFAYDLHDDGGKVGDDFMNRIQSVATVLPYMTCVGNHEIPHNFMHYRYRFSMPNLPWPTREEMWYSFNMGKIHFISYSTEVYFTNGPIFQQYYWLQRDLEHANTPEERAQRPWVIAFGHRPMYCSNADRDDCTKSYSQVREGLEDLFYNQGVDIIIEAHEHSYERFWPMYNGKVTAKHYKDPKAPVHVISGSAGCSEFDGICVNPIIGKKGEWSAFSAWLPGLYGIGRLHVANETHLHWQQRIALNDQVLDEFWVEQHNHGPFTSS